MTQRFDDSLIDILAGVADLAAHAPVALRSVVGHIPMEFDLKSTSEGVCVAGRAPQAIQSRALTAPIGYLEFDVRWEPTP